MRKVIVLAAVITLTFIISLNAQSLKFGVTGGLNFTQLNFDDILVPTNTRDVTLKPVSDRSTGYHVGLVGQAADLFVEFKFEGSISNLGDGVTIGNEDYSYDSRMKQMIVSVGFLF